MTPHDLSIFFTGALVMAGLIVGFHHLFDHEKYLRAQKRRAEMIRKTSYERRW